MKTQQPEWQFVQNLGDADPIAYGGLFVYVDKTGVYRPEVEHLQPPDEDPEDTNRKAWMVHRFQLNPVTYINGIVSDNPYHPAFQAWWATDYNPERPQDGPGRIHQLASFIGSTPRDVIHGFTHHDVRVRAIAWSTIGDLFGFIELDQYPLQFTRAEVEERYKDEIAVESDRRRRGEFKTFKNVWAPLPDGGRIYGFASDPMPVSRGLTELSGRTIRVIASSVEDAAILKGPNFLEEHISLVTPGQQWGADE